MISLNAMSRLFLESDAPLTHFHLFGFDTPLTNVVVNGTAGNDFIHRAGDGHVPPAGYNNITSATAGGDFIDGKDGDDIVFADNGFNDIHGGNGNDVLNGGADGDDALGDNGKDTLYGNQSVDSMSGGNARDTLYGGSGGDLMSGNVGNDKLYGDANADKLYGDDGEDTLVGGGGNDTMTGGLEEDYFVLENITDTGNSHGNRDLIADFSQAEHDEIDLRRIDADSSASGDQRFHFVGTAFTGHARDLIFFADGPNTVVAGDVNGDGASDFQIEIAGTITFVAGDFDL